MIRRLALMVCAIAAVAGSPIASGLAHARGDDDQRGSDRGRGDRGGDRGGRNDQGDRGRGENRDRGESRDRSGERRRDEAPPRRDWDRDRPPGRDRSEERRRYPDEQPRGPPRVGGYLPPSSRGAVVEDYSRFRLRPPPRGFAWVRMGGGYGLVSLTDGRVYDMVPD